MVLEGRLDLKRTPAAMVSENLDEEGWRNMKVLVVNGSTRSDGCTHRALAEVADALGREGVASEIVQLSARPVRDCAGFGCGKCVEACPFGVMVHVEGAPAASKCIACGICVKACPMEVLEIRES